MYTVDQLRAIAGSGGGFELDAYGYTVDQLRAIAGSASSSGARITINLSRKKFTVDQLRAIASSGSGCVFFKNLI
ncbi:hypothetical protein ACT4YP_13380 [Acinetobacter baumannii]|uniref:hypothetical protein n=1 Tax=Acinetobacter calcoaceticus/baumannii complex TaxID=909768 RepID=UPI0004B84A6C|nr:MULTISPECIES: hypothetical protein [Acinetobacter calcoaceticus/baumannii complex]MBN6521076.1 hypothetical protein [Acinetobacter pittii]MDI9752808.1 hypothetical protein [Acinetobacter baumannii]RZG94555.1 hypothetical protein EXE07_13960 [Acinetobacter pittii]CAI3121815.1 hypothetical protein MWMV4_MWMV4_03561 [Acinetobacter baumannii]